MQDDILRWKPVKGAANDPELTPEAVCLLACAWRASDAVKPLRFLYGFSEGKFCHLNDRARVFEDPDFYAILPERLADDDETLLSMSYQERDWIKRAIVEAFDFSGLGAVDVQQRQRNLIVHLIRQGRMLHRLGFPIEATQVMGEDYKIDEWQTRNDIRKTGWFSGEVQRQQARHKCAVRVSDTVVYLADGTKVSIKRDPQHDNYAALQVEEQTRFSVPKAIGFVEKQEEQSKEYVFDPDNPFKEKLREYYDNLGPEGFRRQFQGTWKPEKPEPEEPLTAESLEPGGNLYGNGSKYFSASELASFREKFYLSLSSGGLNTLVPQDVIAALADEVAEHVFASIPMEDRETELTI